MNIYTIYKATNKLNGKCYIGFDSHWPNRKSRHKSEYNKHNYKFYLAIRKYGWDNFEWDAIYQSKDKNDTFNNMENYFIELYDSIKCGYNTTLGGKGSLGKITSESTKSKQSLANKGKIPHNKGKPNTLVTKQKISNKASKFWEVVYPNGAIIQIKNMNQFCKENNLFKSNMYRVSQNKQKHHRGFTCRKI